MRGGTALLSSLVALSVRASPEQIHVSYTGNARELALDFVASTQSPAFVTVRNFNGKETRVNTTSFHFPQIGYMHQALLSFPGISGGASASYIITADGAPSEAFSVTPELAHPERFAVFGDFGLVNDVCMEDLTAQAKAGAYDSVLHVGDFAYDFEDLFSVQGNLFMSLVQGYGATHPVMPAEGNHEACSTCGDVPELPNSGLNFTQYKGRFHAVELYAGANSGSNSNRYYSFERGLAHFVVLTAEAYLYARTPAFLANQLAWLKADLAAVDRKRTPWLVVLAHKDWTMATEAFADFQPLLDAAKADVLFCGHVHYYNRYMPYDSVTGEVDTASVSADGATYTEPKYMTVIVTGASGDIEADDKYVKESPSFTGTENYGWGVFTALNATHATWDFHTVKADNGPGDYLDHLTIIRTH